MLGRKKGQYVHSRIDVNMGEDGWMTVTKNGVRLFEGTSQDALDLFVLLYRSLGRKGIRRALRYTRIDDVGQ